ncbi:SDR family oxidoreductase [Shimia abyssi]|uniref:NAD(P)-dependent dehydrogenase (Short-subunit alcohol dehydrogenase family) n=1 Tax=Shimia abyssi TaxID=1662395 RepID=A0A2P8FJU0_9RHOB|nr:SDR family oxidoreductase [Shimia abyssi]PSL21987.1 NAD(P)-dependent dehydrogenase (short-subunit alcohol dehydrogenase family) [Shimia abyssi]
MRAAMTGAATGIGAIVAQKLKARGYEVVAFDIAEPEGVDQWVQTDMSDPAAIARAVLEVDGPFECLINNAGLPPRDGLEETILAVNYLGLVQLSEAMLPKLAPGGAVVNTASRAGAMWRDNLVQVKALMALSGPEALSGFVAEQQIDYVRAYNLSKEAVIAWTLAQTERLIAMDLRVNSVSPAAVSTGILEDFTAAFGERVAKNIARVGRPGRPEEVADLIVFLAGSDSHWIRGCDHVIDGGMSALAQTDQLGL